jgi:hypothetical protein
MESICEDDPVFCFVQITTAGCEGVYPNLEANMRVSVEIGRQRSKDIFNSTDWLFETIVRSQMLS